MALSDDACALCGTWECLNCGAARTYASRFAAEPLRCISRWCPYPDRGRMLPTRHHERKRDEHDDAYAALVAAGREPRYPLR